MRSCQTQKHTNLVNGAYLQSFIFETVQPLILLNVLIRLLTHRLTTVDVICHGNRLLLHLYDTGRRLPLRRLFVDIYYLITPLYAAPASLAMLKCCILYFIYSRLQLTKTITLIMIYEPVYLKTEERVLALRHDSDVS